MSNAKRTPAGKKKKKKSKVIGREGKGWWGGRGAQISPRRITKNVPGEGKTPT